MFERILLAVDGSEHGRKAAEASKEMAKLSGAEVLVLHLREREFSRAGSFDLETPAEATELVDGTVRGLKDAGVNARGEIRPCLHGHAAQEILAQAKEFDPGIIVMGSRGLSDLTALLLGSVAHKVIQLAPCPVLVAR